MDASSGTCESCGQGSAAALRQHTVRLVFFFLIVSCTPEERVSRHGMGSRWWLGGWRSHPAASGLMFDNVS